MSIELKVPQVGESITEVQIGEWLRSEGARVEKDEPVVVIETDKVTVELPAPAGGTVSRVLKREGEAARVGEVIGFLEAAGDGAAAEKKPEAASVSRRGTSATPHQPSSQADGAAPTQAPPRTESSQPKGPSESAPPSRTESAPQGRAAPAVDGADGGPDGTRPAGGSGGRPRVSPAARRVLDEHGLSAEDVVATGPGGRVLKENVLDLVEKRGRKEAPAAGRKAAPVDASREDATADTAGADRAAARTNEEAGEIPARWAPGAREEEIVPMSPLRRRIAQRLVEAQAQAALLTTFNEIDMSAVIALRREHGAAFKEKYGIKLGFMSFFVKASIEALKLVPGVNAEIRGTNAVYRNYYDIGVAVGGGRGLVVPVMRSAERMSFAEIEIAIHDFAERARTNALELEELQGGTFTISNGGIYGSMLSTPIVNPPQSGILGLHAIQERPIAREGQVLVAPMMYVALTYDHRIVDGREAVSFLVRIKECMENPARMLIEV